MKKIAKPRGLMRDGYTSYNCGSMHDFYPEVKKVRVFEEVSEEDIHKALIEKFYKDQRV